MRQDSADSPRSETPTTMPPPAEPIPPGSHPPFRPLPAGPVTRRGALRGGLVIGALAAAGGVTAWALLDDSRRAASSTSPSGSRALPAAHSAADRAGSRQAHAGPAGTSDIGKPLPLRYFGSVKEPCVYFTIDDGWYPDRKVLEIMKSEHVPVTTFLIAQAAQENLSYWRDFLGAGGRIENHTFSHPDLTRLPRGQAEHQWTAAQNALRKWFGITPTLGRPPYGAFNDSVSIAARNAGLTTLVNWSAADTNGTVQTWNSTGKLTPGEITLTHWAPGVDTDFEQLLAAARESSLTPSYLPGTW